MKSKKELALSPVKSELILYQTGDGKTKVAVFLQDETVGLNQKLMAELFQTSVPSINGHISNIFEEGELAADSVIKDFLTTAADGKNYQNQILQPRCDHLRRPLFLTHLPAFYRSYS